MKRKTLDCVELQHRGGAKLQARLAQMTPDEERAFWQKQAKRLREEQKAAARNRDEAGSSAR